LFSIVFIHKTICIYQKKHKTRHTCYDGPYLTHASSHGKGQVLQVFELYAILLEKETFFSGKRQI
jgi:hypothetical protein